MRQEFSVKGKKDLRKADTKSSQYRIEPEMFPKYEGAPSGQIPGQIPRIGLHSV